MNERTFQPVSQSVSQSVGQSISRSVSQSISRTVNQSVSLSVNQSDSQSAGQSVSRSVSQSVSHSISRTVISQSVSQSISRTVISRSVSQSVSQSVSHSEDGKFSWSVILTLSGRWITHTVDLSGITKIKRYLYGKRKTADASWEFLKIENEQIKIQLLKQTVFSSITINIGKL